MGLHLLTCTSGHWARSLGMPTGAPPLPAWGPRLGCPSSVESVCVPARPHLSIQCLHTHTHHTHTPLGSWRVRNQVLRTCICYRSGAAGAVGLGLCGWLAHPRIQQGAAGGPAGHLAGSRLRRGRSARMPWWEGARGSRKAPGGGSHLKVGKWVSRRQETWGHLLPGDHGKSLLSSCPPS